MSYTANDDIAQSQHAVDSTLTRDFTYDAKQRLKTVTGTNANQSFTLDLRTTAPTSIGQPLWEQHR